MNKIKLISYIPLLFMLLFGVETRAANRIYSDPQECQVRGSIAIPLKMDNTAEIVAAEFDVTLPDGLSAVLDGSTWILKGERLQDHAVVTKKMGSKYKVVVYSIGGKNIRGNKGVFLYMPVAMRDDIEIGTKLDITLSNIVITDKDGNNLADSEETVIEVTAADPDTPDITVKDITTSVASINPGEAFSIGYNIINQGNLVLANGWKEDVSLVASTGEELFLGTFHHQGDLSAGASVERNEAFTLPTLPGIEGDVSVRVKVTPYADSGEHETRVANNTVISTATMNVKKLLTLTVPASIDEQDTGLKKCVLTRSGFTALEESFNLTFSDASRLTLTGNATFVAGTNSVTFYVSAIDDNIVNVNNDITVSIAAAHGYSAVQGTVTINDDDNSQLTAEATASEVTEGGKFNITVSSNRPVTTGPLEVKVTCDQSSRLLFPTTITIPAGQNSVTMEVEALDDDVPQLEAVGTFTFTAVRHDPTELLIALMDNDMPELEFILQPTTVSESAGVNAITARLVRKSNTNKEVTINLSDNSNGKIYYSRQSITMPKGVDVVEFTLGVIDNALVDGDSEVTITAAVLVQSCNCSSTQEGVGLVSQTLTIIDNDGPSLTITASSSSIREGDDNGVNLTISRNTDTSEALTINLSSDQDDQLNYDHTATIPAGATSVVVNVKAPLNEETEGNRTVVFSATSNGFSQGTTWLVITDQTLPDAVIQLTDVPTEVEAEETVRLVAEVSNIGHQTLPANTLVNFYFSGDRYPVSVNTDKPLEPGESTQVEGEYELPASTGDYSFYATVNENKSVNELIYTNNYSERVGIKLLPRFRVTAQADKDVYRHGEAITITGQASGSAGKNAKVEVYIINNGFRQTMNGITDSEGYYSMEWQPLDRQSGHFIVGACYPGTNETTEMDAFDLYGIQLDGFYTTCQFCLGDMYNGTIRITNPGRLPQTGLKIEMKASSGNCDFTFSPVSQIDAGETVELQFTIQGNGVTEGTNWQQMPIEISTDEGSTASHTIYYYVQPHKATLQANTNQINTTMTIGQVREYPITVTNIGKAETGTITLALPKWISTETAHELASLNSGDSTTIVLRLVPNDDMKLNVPVDGQLGINCANGDGVAIHFTVTPVSGQTGNLIVDAVDELTFFTSDAPHIENAKVVVKHPVSGAVITEGTTDEEGKFRTTIPEGWYKITVEAANHKSYSNTLVVDPGRDNEHEVFLSYQSITYSWEVVETEVEDVYEIVTVAKYETRVPKPVVIVSLPDEEPQPNSIIPVTVTNEGLISAVDVNMSLSTDNDDFYFEFMNDPVLDTLRARQSHVFYAKMVPAHGNEVATRKPMVKKADKTCITIISKAKYKELCDKYENEELVYAMKKWGPHICATNYGGIGGGGGGIGGGTYRGGSSGPGHPVISGQHNYDDVYIIYDTEDPAKYCTPPMPLPSLPEGEPERVPCGEDFNLDYKLITVDGNRNLMKGVAADGSELLIILDPTTSQLPSDKCDYKISWSVPKGFGEIIKDSNNPWYAHYFAPVDFPDPVKKDTTFQARLIFEDGFASTAVFIDITLTRAPVVLLHGLNSDKSAWSKYAKYLTTGIKDDKKGTTSFKGYYNDYQVYCADYSEFNCHHFRVNQKRPGIAIRNVIRQCKENGIMASRADLVGHSMGGILSRLYVQYEEDAWYNVHKIITVNTPHSGSEIGDMVMSSGILKAGINFFNIMDFSSTDAVDDLRVNSPETDDYLNNPDALNMMKGTPVHSMSSIVDDWLGAIAVGVEGGVTFLTTDRSLGIGIIDWLSKLGIKKHLNAAFAAEIEVALSCSDLVVSEASQKGGLEYPQNTPNRGSTLDACHVKVTEWEKTWDDLTFLLKDSVNSNSFSRNGFHPVDLSVSTDHVESPSPKFISASPEESLDIDLQIVRDSLHVAMDPRYADEEYQYLCVRFSNGDMATCKKEMTVAIPSVHEGLIKAYAVVRIGDQFIEGEKSINVSAPKANPVRLEPISTIYMLTNDTTTVKLTCIWDDGSETTVIPDAATATNGIAVLKNGRLIAKKAGNGTIKFLYKNLSASNPIVIYKSSDDEEGDDSPTICSTVSLSFKQRMVMTRQAFRGTLTVNNGSEIGAMTDVKLNLEVRDPDGQLTTSHEFQINPESLNGFEGELDFDTGWTLNAGGTGIATILFIPTKYAAPTEPIDYSFGGTFSFKDPSTGLYVTRDLNPVTLTVKPSPELDLDYFMQRDVFGDDPLTAEVEPMQPAEFALLINNKGYGDATQVRMTTNQPEIIDNEKGLLIDFEILGSQVNGQDLNLAFGQSIVNDFGTIPAHSQAYAQWWLQSSLLGHFKEYNVSANHVTSYGNEDLSLLNEVTIHELIHGFTAQNDGEVPVRGFLVNDIADAEDKPDAVYLTDATQQNAFIATDITATKQSDTEYLLNVEVSQAGWNYCSIFDPTLGKQRLVTITRQSDGVDIPLDNIWQTDRTLRDGKDPLYENLLHFIGNIASSSESYLLTFEDKPETTLDVESIVADQNTEEVLKASVSTVTVTFNKPVVQEDVNASCLTLHHQGKKVDIEEIVITKVDETTYAFDVTPYTYRNGYYVFTIQTADIHDTEGFLGKNGRQLTWTQQKDLKKVVLDELSTVPPTAEEEVEVTVKRTLKTGEWNTICLPFTMNSVQVKSEFGDDVQILDFTGYNVTKDDKNHIVGIDVNFTSVEAIEANHPYLIAVTKPFTSFNAYAVDIEPVEVPKVATITRTNNLWSEFIGTYVAEMVVPNNMLFLNANKFYYSTGQTKMKAFRAYFDFSDVLDDLSDANARIRINIDDDITAIRAINAGKMSEGVFTLQGVFIGKNPDISKLPKGVYIVDGRKVFVK